MAATRRFPPPPDADERDRALDPSGSFLVQAPAGSGKTTLLVQRYLRLLETVQRPEEILAITFTRKAAGEMFDRIVAELVGDNPVDPALTRRVLERDQRLDWGLLDNPSRLTVQTIDSFCMQLLRQFPDSSRSSAARLVESAGHLYEQAVERLFMRPHFDDPLSDRLAAVLATFDNDFARVRALLISMLGTRDQWIGTVTSLVSGQYHEPERLDRILDDGLTRFTAAICTEARQTVARALGVSGAAALDAALEHARGERGLPVLTQSELAYWRAAAELLLTSAGRLRRRVDRSLGFPPGPDKDALLELLTQIADTDLVPTIRHWRTLPESDDPATEREIVHTFALVLSLAAVELAAVFADEDASDFVELTIAAQRAMISGDGPSDLALALDYRIQHILVDEFQDTSLGQFALFEQLVEGWEPGDGRTLFAVGDPMQSIYRFRNADVELFFRAARDGVGAVALTPVTLTANFRSGASLVGWYNQTFSEVMSGDIRYSSAVAVHDGDLMDAVRCEQYADSESEALAVCDRIDAIRCVDADATIAVLVRGRNHLADIVRVMREQQITWHATDIATLADDPVVSDLVALLTVLLRPADRLAWATILRCPLVGLDLADISAAGSSRLDEPDATRLSRDGRARLDRLRAVLARWLPTIDELAPRSSLEGCWFDLGGTDAYDARALSSAERLFVEVDRLGPRGFDVAELGRALNALYVEYDADDADVEVMTIYKAKGLEFDHVLLPGLGRTVRPVDTPMLLWHAGTDQPLIIAPRSDTGLFGWLWFDERRKNQLELQRLLYVACTRAVQSLHLFAFGSGKPATGSLLAELAPHVPFDAQASATTPEPGAGERSTGPVRIGPVRERLRSSYQTDPHGTVDIGAAFPGAPSNRGPVGPGLADRPSIETTAGVVTHQLLAWLANGAQLDVGVAELRDAVDRTIERLPSAERVGVDAGAVRDRVMTALTNTLEDATGRWLLARHADGECEAAYSGIVDGVVRRIIVDRTFVTSAGVRWIVDYKSTDPGEPTVAQRDQLALYAAILGACYPEPIRAALWFTTTARLVEVDFSNVRDQTPSPIE